MNKQEILRQLQSRIDKRSNEITHYESYLIDCSASEFAGEYHHEYRWLDKLRYDQTLDKRIYGHILMMDKACFELECLLINAINAANMDFKVS